MSRPSAASPPGPWLRGTASTGESGLGSDIARQSTYADTGLHYSSSSARENRASWRAGTARRARSLRRAPAARANRALPTRADPLEAAGPRRTIALHARTCQRARRLAWGCHRGLRTARRRGLSHDQPRCTGTCRQGRARGKRTAARALAAAGLLLQLPARLGGGRGAPPAATRRWTHSATATRVARRLCAKRSPDTWAVYAVPTPIPSTCSCAPASCKASHCCVAPCAGAASSR
jgi:hypothetical protein